MISEFSKGFRNIKMWEGFKAAVAEGDCTEINGWVSAEGMQRLPVDCMVYALKNHDNDLIVENTDFNDSPQVNTEAFTKELDQVIEAAHMRDVPMADLDPEVFPLGMREVSFALQGVVVPKYAEGINYGTTEEDFKSIQRGDDQPAVTPIGTTHIVTGRDAAAYVHADDPLSPWDTFLAQLLAEGVPFKTPSYMPDGTTGQANFTVFGFPHFKGLLGETLRRLGPISFRAKYNFWFPRPEEMAPVLGKGYLPLAYPEGSPMHPARPAMHSFAALTVKHVVLNLFDNNVTLDETGRTVASEAALLADNQGMWRVHAGVHYMSDHTACEPRCKALADRITTEFLR